MHRRRPSVPRVLGSLAIVVALASCGAQGADPRGAFDGASLTIEARGLAFDPVIGTMPAGEPLRLILDNQDEGVGHNLHVFQGDTDFGTSGTVIGPGLAAIELPAMPVGSYQFECTLHPDMIGTLVVAAGATPGPTPADDTAPPDASVPPDASAPPGESAPPDASALPSDSAAPGDSSAPGDSAASGGSAGPSR